MYENFLCKVMSEIVRLGTQLALKNGEYEENDIYNANHLLNIFIDECEDAYIKDRSKKLKKVK